MMHIKEKHGDLSKQYFVTDSRFVLQESTKRLIMYNNVNFASFLSLT